MIGFPHVPKFGDSLAIEYGSIKMAEIVHLISICLQIPDMPVILHLLLVKQGIIYKMNGIYFYRAYTSPAAARHLGSMNSSWNPAKTISQI